MTYLLFTASRVEEVEREVVISSPWISYGTRGNGVTLHQGKVETGHQGSFI